MTRFVDPVVDLKCAVFSLVGKGGLGKVSEKTGRIFKGLLGWGDSIQPMKPRKPQGAGGRTVWEARNQGIDTPICHKYPSVLLAMILRPPKRGFGPRVMKIFLSLGGVWENMLPLLISA